MIEEFLRKFGMPLPEEPTTHDIALAFHRLGLIYEELIEYETALVLALQSKTTEERNQYFEDMVDALGDIIYAAAGTALIHGFDIHAALKEIHRANMEKERGIGKRGHSCDVIKPPGWKPPKHQLRRQRTKPMPLLEWTSSSEPSSSSASVSEQLQLPGL